MVKCVRDGDIYMRYAGMANCTIGLGVLLISILILAPVNKPHLMPQFINKQYYYKIKISYCVFLD